MTPDERRAWLASLSIDAPERVDALLLEYRQLIQHYGRRVNLVGRLDDAFIDDELVLGSLQLLAVARPRGRLVDVGSGAGLPGIPLALALPDLEVTLVEARQKRAAFLRRATTLLGLDNVRVIDERIESLEQRFDWAVSRAFKPPQQWLRLATQLVEPGGHVALFTTRGDWGTVELGEDLHVVGRSDDSTGVDRIVVVVCSA